MLLIDEEKLPPPNPDSRAIMAKVKYGVLIFDSEIPVPIAGITSRSVVKKITFLPPPKEIRKELGNRKVAPARPAIAGNV